MCSKFAKYINSHTELGCCKKICSWLLFTLVVATITIGTLSATIYKDKWTSIWVTVITAKCEPNCELESCLVKCDMSVSYKCHAEIIYYNFTSNALDRTYTAGDKILLDRNNYNCKLEIDDRLPLGNMFLYICVGGLTILLLASACVGAVIFVYRDTRQDKLPTVYNSVINDDNVSETTPLTQITDTRKKHGRITTEIMPHIHF